jgi:hypothetical protein
MFTSMLPTTLKREANKAKAHCNIGIRPSGVVPHSHHHLA